MSLSFKVGEKIVYPQHGVTVVESVGQTNFEAMTTDFYHLRLLSNDSRLMVPVANSDRVGLRKLYKIKDVKALLTQLELKENRKTRDWKDRYRENLEKMKSGRLEDVADVLKNLTQICRRKTLSFREKKMYERAKHLVVSEVAIVKGIDEDTADVLIEKSLDKGLGPLEAA